MTASVGSDMIRYCAATSVRRSVSTFTTSHRPACAFATFSTSGATMRHGPHHAAQKSTTSGIALVLAAALNADEEAASNAASGGGSIDLHFGQRVRLSSVA